MRPTPRDRLLLFGLLAVWAVAFVLHVDGLVRGEVGWVPVFVDGATHPESAPVLRGLWDGTATPSGPQAGDALLAAGPLDLRGRGPLGVHVALIEAARGTLEVPLRVRDAAGAEVSRTLRLVEVPWGARKALLSLAFAVLGALALWRSGTRAGRLFFLAMGLYALNWTDAWSGGGAWRASFGIAAFALGSCGALVAAQAAALAFPPETARHGRAARLWPWLFVLPGLGTVSWAFGAPLPGELGQVMALVGSVAFMIVFCATLAQSYRRASAGGRRQLRWVLLGFWVGFAPAIVIGSLAALEPAGWTWLVDRYELPPLWRLYEISLSAAIAIPICLWLALTRDNFLDVDRLLTSAAGYTAASIALLAVAFGVAPLAARALAEQIDPALSQAIMALGAAALIVPGRRLVTRPLERRFFPERARLAQAVASLGEDVDLCEKPWELYALLGDRLRARLQVDAASVYARAGEVFAPAFAHGPAVAPALRADGRLLARLAERERACDVVRLAPAAATRTERAALEAMGAEVVLPIHDGGQLAAFVCLGGKRSGDVFTDHEAALLQSLAARAGRRLREFDEEQRRAQERELTERLRRYVPGAVEQSLERGGTADLEPAEREISVLFVDVRGYTTFSEGRAPGLVFGVVNRYTEAVSRSVRKFGGGVVEFNGDGMMSVFGAPVPMPDKEAAALAAAREIVAAVRGLALEDGGDPAGLEVGAGIATGPACVGNIRAVDRHIWTAIGDTVNLAARLEKLTRELDASIAIDAATRDAAGAAAADFVPSARRAVRGRAEPVDIHVLPLSSPTTGSQ